MTWPVEGPLKTPVSDAQGSVHHTLKPRFNVNTLKIGRLQNFTYVTMFFLYKFKERRHIWATKMVDGLQPREHTRLGQTLKVVFTNVLQRPNHIILVQLKTHTNGTRM